MATILIADPTSALTDPVTAALRQAGHQPLLARDGDQAWQIAQCFHIDLLITDRLLPGLGGAALIDRLRREPAYAHLPVILLGDGGPTPLGVTRLSGPVPPAQVQAAVQGLIAGGTPRDCAG